MEGLSNFEILKLINTLSGPLEAVAKIEGAIIDCGLTGSVMQNTNSLESYTGCPYYLAPLNKIEVEFNEE